MKNIPFLGKGSEHDLTTEEGRDRERLELLLLQRTADFRDVPSRVLDELADQCKAKSPPTTLAEVVATQVAHAVNQFHGRSIAKDNVAPFLLPNRKIDTLMKTA